MKIYSADAAAATLDWYYQFNPPLNTPILYRARICKPDLLYKAAIDNKR